MMWIIHWIKYGVKFPYCKLGPSFHLDQANLA
jgi:hypothetical protein